MTENEKRAMLAHVELAQYAQAKLGVRQWGLLSSYGKMMSGPPYGGLYVSGIPSEVGRQIVDALVAGETVEVHLMHRHRSGTYEASSLRFLDGQFWMVFDDREVLA